VVRSSQPIDQQGGTKQRILDAATELFATKGYGSSSIRDIAARVGIEPASVYSHVASKEDILFSIVMTSTEASLALIREAVEAAGSSHRDRLAAATRAHVEYFCRHGLTALIGWAEIRSLGEERFAVMSDLRSSYEHVFRDEIVAGIAAGEFRETDASLATNGIIGIGTRAAVWYTDAGPLSPEEVGDYYAEFVLRSLLA
jgi:AcrR family transcriptional regulator